MRERVADTRTFCLVCDAMLFSSFLSVLSFSDIFPSAFDALVHYTNRILWPFVAVVVIVFFFSREFH